MVQFLSINFFSWISSIFVGFFKSSHFFVSPCTTCISTRDTWHKSSTIYITLHLHHYHIQFNAEYGTFLFCACAICASLPSILSNSLPPPFSVRVAQLMLNSSGITYIVKYIAWNYQRAKFPTHAAESPLKASRFKIFPHFRFILVIPAKTAKADWKVSILIFLFRIRWIYGPYNFFLF